MPSPRSRTKSSPAPSKAGDARGTRARARAARGPLDPLSFFEGESSPATLYLEVDDVHAEIDRLRAAGIAITHEPHVIFSHTNQTLGPAGTDEWQAFVTDPDGTLVGLVGYTPTA